MKTLKNTEIAKVENNLTNWGDKAFLAEVKEIYGKGLTDSEFKILIGIGKTTGLNPFLREIWAVKYNDQPACIFIARDGYRKSAQQDPEYDYHFSDAVYEKDNFTVENGEIKHNYNVAERGDIKGGYAIVKRKSAEKAMFCYVDFKEYYAGHRDAKGNIKKGKFGDMKPTLWDTKPATMIKKVAEAQALRMTFQGLFANTYDESEQWDENTDKTIIEVNTTQDQEVKPPAEVIKAPIAPVQQEEKIVYINKEQVERIKETVKERGITQDQFSEVLGKRELKTLTHDEAEGLIAMLGLVRQVSPEKQEAIDATQPVPFVTRAMECKDQFEAIDIIGEATLSKEITETKMTALKNILSSKGYIV